jgi:hypothetical protein
MNCTTHPRRAATTKIRRPGSPRLVPVCASCHEEFVLARYPRSGRAAAIRRTRAGERAEEQS